MSLSRQEILAEMGLSPRWVLRDGEALPVARRPAGGTTKAGANVAHSAVNEVRDEEAILTRPIDDSPAGDTVGPADVADMDWDELRQTILGCRACPLCEQRKQAVPGVGDERAGWMFIGEGPGAEEGGCDHDTMHPCPASPCASGCCSSSSAPPASSSPSFE